MKLKNKIISVLLIAGMAASLASCSGDSTSSNAPAASQEEKVTITPKYDLKGAWTVVSTPEAQSISNTDWSDMTTMYDSTLRGSISAIFMQDSTFEVFDNGICSVNGGALEYEFVAPDTVMFTSKGSGLIFKVSQDGDKCTLKLNEKYEVVLQKK